MLLLSSRAQVEVDMMKVMRAVSHNVIVAQATRNFFVQTEFRTGVGRASRVKYSSQIAPENTGRVLTSVLYSLYDVRSISPLNILGLVDI